MKIRLVINTKRPWKVQKSFYMKGIHGSGRPFFSQAHVLSICETVHLQHEDTQLLHTPEPTVLSIILPILAPASRESSVRRVMIVYAAWNDFEGKWAFSALLSIGLEACSLHVWMGKASRMGTMYDRTLTHLQRFLSCHYQFISWECTS